MCVFESLLKSQYNEMREDFEGCIDGPRVFFRQVYITIVYTAFNLPARVHVYQFECLNTCKSLC